MRIYVKKPNILYTNRYPKYVDYVEKAQEKVVKAKELLKSGNVVEAMKALPTGVYITIDGVQYHQYEDEYGFIGLIRYYKGNGWLYPSVDNEKICEMIANAKTVSLQYVGSGYMREPMFT